MFSEVRELGDVEWCALSKTKIEEKERSAQAFQADTGTGTWPHVKCPLSISRWLPCSLLESSTFFLVHFPVDDRSIGRAPLLLLLPPQPLY